MTRADLIWAAAYAAGWYQACSPVVGVVTDERRAAFAAEQADRAVAALRPVRPEVGE